MVTEQPEIHIDEMVVLQKFNGDVQTPEFLVERVHIHNGKIIKHEYIEDGVVVKTELFKEVD